MLLMPLLPQAHQPQQAQETELTQHFPASIEQAEQVELARIKEAAEKVLDLVAQARAQLEAGPQ
jgi:hypothetical protein